MNVCMYISNDVCIIVASFTSDMPLDVVGGLVIRGAASRNGLSLGAVRVRHRAARVRHRHGSLLRLRPAVLLHHAQVAPAEAPRHRQTGQGTHTNIHTNVLNTCKIHLRRPTRFIR